ncbi:hypothetical protein EDB83DRAFT_1848022 [Lactarius deliciosus]|nr:hypothetical protein EDB83DRAFT_1848022 [Lactarius deliciosus]
MSTTQVWSSTQVPMYFCRCHRSILSLRVLSSAADTPTQESVTGHRSTSSLHLSPVPFTHPEPLDFATLFSPIPRHPTRSPFSPSNIPTVSFAMVRVLSITSLALAAVSAVSGFVVPRMSLSPPNGWETDILEPYCQYRERYLALQCQHKHGRPFFDQSCHPLLATQKLESRPPQYIPDDCGDGSDNTTISPSSSLTNVTPMPTYISPKPTHTPEPSSSTSSPKPSPSTSTPKPKASPTLVSRSSEGSNGSDVNDGQASYFYQNGVAGACGTVHSDDDFICAMDQTRYGDSDSKSSLCGQQVWITNTQNGKNVTVTVADDCSSCINANSIGLSKAAFKAIASLSDGVVPIEWSFV